MSYAIWHPALARAEVLVAHGVHFSNMGHSAPRPYVDEEGVIKAHKRLELLPEEAIYLIERGALFCSLADAPKIEVTGMEDAAGPPMTVQQAYTEMIGREGLTLEKFQVGNSAYISLEPCPLQCSIILLLEHDSSLNVIAHAQGKLILLPPYRSTPTSSASATSSPAQIRQTRTTRCRRRIRRSLVQRHPMACHEQDPVAFSSRYFQRFAAASPASGKGNSTGGTR